MIRVLITAQTKQSQIHSSRMLNGFLQHLCKVFVLFFLLFYLVLVQDQRDNIVFK